MRVQPSIGPVGLCALSALRHAVPRHNARALTMRTSFSASDFPTEWPYSAADFTRMDESADFNFYSAPRFVTHIDEGAISSLTTFYANELKPGADILDVCSSWISHLPENLALGRVAGVGMNARELEANKQLTEWVQEDLNVKPRLPFDDESFDAVLCVVSIDYLTRPREVVGEFHRVLRPGGRVLLSFSNRMFATKAISKWLSLGDDGRQRMAASYFFYAPPGGWEDVGTEKLPPARRSPVAKEAGGLMGKLFELGGFSDMVAGLGDPMYVVSATKKSE